MQHQRHTDLSHLEGAMRAFPDDPGILFLAGALRELSAEPRIQEVVDTVDLPYGMKLGIESPRDELRGAERLFRRALEKDPRMTEARIRRGNVLGLLGRHEEAVKELEQALDSVGEDPLLTYYARMFLGRSADALGDVNKAHASYERAALLYPRAQSPTVALDRLGRLAGGSSPQDALDRAIRSGRADANDDPWWRYASNAGRSSDTLIAEARERFVGGTGTRQP